MVPKVNSYHRALELFPGGVNDPVRSFQAVGGEPIAFRRGHGAVLMDDQGRSFLDFVQGWGSQILGHTPAAVVGSLRRQASMLTGAGSPSESEIRLATLIRSAFGSMERLRFVDSATEAIMCAVRVARAATARPLVIKFDGCSHGHSDGLMVHASSGLSSVGLPSSAGVDPRQASGTVSVPYNDLTSVQLAFEAKPDKIAAILVEPVVTTMGLISPKPGFLSGLRRLADEHGALLIFDEGTTGFRLCWGGAQTIYGVVPDLTVLGKIIGAGLPVGAFGGKRELMGLLAPEGPVLQSDPLAGNPLVMEAGVAVLEKLHKPHFYERLEDRAGRWAMGFRRLLTPGQQSFHTQGSLFSLFFHPGPIHDFAMAVECNQELYGRFFHGLVERGVYLPPSPFETGFIGAAHTKGQIERALVDVEVVLTALHC